MAPTDGIHGQGLGLRRVLLSALCDTRPPEIDFLETAPENWLGLGGPLARRLRACSERYPLTCHGLSLNLGGWAPLDIDFLHEIKAFLALHHAQGYSEHLSYCADDGHLYELLPIPFTDEAVHYVAARVRRVQEVLECRIAVENVAYYAAPGAEMTELEFLLRVLEEADCDLLLDLNNLYVNSINHGQDPPHDFLRALPTKRIIGAHIAGHLRTAPDLLLDTHGEAVSEPVWDLLVAAYRVHGALPTVLERDANLPSLAALVSEMSRIGRLQQASGLARG